MITFYAIKDKNTNKYFNWLTAELVDDLAVDCIYHWYSDVEEDFQDYKCDSDWKIITFTLEDTE